MQHILVDCRPLQDPFFTESAEIFSWNFFIALFRNFPDFSFFLWTNGEEGKNLPLSFEEFENVHRLHTNESKFVLHFLSENFSYPHLDDMLEIEAMKRGKMPWSEHFDVVFSLAPFSMPVEKNCMKIVFAEHFSHFFYPSHFSFEHQKIQKKSRYIQEFLESEMVFVLSEFDKKEYVSFSKKLEAEKFSSLLVGVEDHFGEEILEEEKQEFLEAKNLEKPFFAVPFFGEEFDNFPIMEQAFALFSARFSEKSWDMVFFSHVPLDPELTENVHEGVRFVVLENEEERKKLLATAKAFVAPWAFGGKWEMVLQAMQYGVPVLSSNFSGLPELLEDAAIFFDPTSSVSVFRAMKKIFSDENLYAEISEKAMMHGQQEKFSWDEVGKNVMHCILQCQEEKEMEEEL